LCGLERFFIEKIRVNSRYEFLGISVTQAEIIAVLLMIAGTVGLVLLSKKETQQVGSK
jgi:phosphatidylglycerol:prolipoprotein diacylglycerol transferase